MTKILASIITLLLVAACAPQAELVKTRSDMGDLRVVDIVPVRKGVHLVRTA